MQLKPMGLEENWESTLDLEHGPEIILEEKYQGDMVSIYSIPKILNSILLLTMGYFTVATELRLIATEKYKSEESRKKSQ